MVKLEYKNGDTGCYYYNEGYGKKLTLLEVKEIKELLWYKDKSCKEIANMFKVHMKTIYSIKNKKTWAHEL